MQYTTKLSLLLLLTGSFNASADVPIIEPEMVTIPAGSFIMGGDKKKQQPRHHVDISSFKLAKHEVTVKEFRQFVSATNHKTRNVCWVWQGVQPNNKWGITRTEGNWQESKHAPSDDHPVMCVTWEDAKAYASWLGKKTGKLYRLPTESEWEYAARAGSNSKYFFGDNPKQLCEYANVFDRQGAKAFLRDHKIDTAAIECDDGSEYTSVVGQYKPNAFGLYDMIGNVGEFVQDCEHDNYQNAPSDGRAWEYGCNYEQLMVIHRGGSYGSGTRGSNIATRSHAGPDNPSSLGEGFRLAETIISK